MSCSMQRAEGGKLACMYDLKKFRPDFEWTLTDLYAIWLEVS